MDSLDLIERRVEAVVRRSSSLAERAFLVSGPDATARQARVFALLDSADKMLGKRLSAWSAAHGGDTASFSPATMRGYQAQIRMMVEQGKQHVAGQTVQAGSAAWTTGTQAARSELVALEQAFTGAARSPRIMQALQMDLSHGPSSSVLRSMATSVDRYGVSMIGEFERNMQLGFVAGLTQGEMVELLTGHGGPKGTVSTRARVVNGSVVRTATEQIPEGLFRRYRSWAWRIVRTEVSNAYNGAKIDTFIRLREAVPGMQKKILAHFDTRTATDSVAVHGQIRDLDGANSMFLDGAGRSYEHPPARPNDRETIIPWHPDWGEVPSTAQLTPDEQGAADSAIAAGLPAFDPAARRIQDIASEAGHTSTLEQSLQSFLTPTLPPGYKLSEAGGYIDVLNPAGQKAGYFKGALSQGGPYTVQPPGYLQPTHPLRTFGHVNEAGNYAIQVSEAIAATKAAQAAALAAEQASAIATAAASAAEQAAAAKALQTAAQAAAEASFDTLVGNLSTEMAAAQSAVDQAVAGGLSPQMIGKLKKKLAQATELYEDASGAYGAMQDGEVLPQVALTNAHARQAEIAASHARKPRGSRAAQAAANAARAGGGREVYAGSAYAREIGAEHVDYALAPEHYINHPRASTPGGIAIPVDGDQFENLELRVRRRFDENGREYFHFTTTARAEVGDRIRDGLASRGDFRNGDVRWRATDVATNPNGPLRLRPEGEGRTRTCTGGRTFTPTVQMTRNGVASDVSFGFDERCRTGSTLDRTTRGTVTQGTQPAAELNAMHNRLDVRVYTSDTAAALDSFEQHAESIGFHEPLSRPSDDHVRTQVRSQILARWSPNTQTRIDRMTARTASGIDAIFEEAAASEPILRQIEETTSAVHAAHGGISFYSDELAAHHGRRGSSGMVHSLYANDDEALFGILKSFGQDAGGASILATTERWDRGMTYAGGQSSDADVRTGGAFGVFTRQRRTLEATQNNVTFSRGELGRLDAIAHNTDRYGQVGSRRTRFFPSSSAGLQSDNEFLPRGSIPMASVREIGLSRATRERMITRLRSEGVTHFGSRPIEDVLVAK